MNQTFKRAMSLFMAMAMVLSMVPSFGTHAHAEELETESVVVTEAPATEAPVVEAPETEAPETEAPTQAPETEAPATEAPVVETEAPTEAPEAPETEAAEETTEATEPAVETEPVEETTPDATEETVPEEFLEEEIIVEEAVAESFAGFSYGSLLAEYYGKYNAKKESIENGTVNWSYNEDSQTILCVLEGYKANRTSNLPVLTKLELTNSSEEDAELRFHWSLSNGGTIASEDGSLGESSADSGEYSALLKANSTVVFWITSPNGKAETTLKIENIDFAESSTEVTVVFSVPDEGGSYTLNGQPVTEETSVVTMSGTKLEVLAEPGKDYLFYGWYNSTTQSFVSYSQRASVSASDNMVLIPLFVPDTTALFGVGAVKFDSLTDAAQYAANGSAKTVVLLNDGIISGSYVIPTGVTLLIPFDDANTLYTDTPEYVSSMDAAWTQPSAYRTLTLAENTEITVNGAISVGGKHFAGGSGSNAGSPTGKVGFVNMKKDSKIILNSGANLYTWGYIVGSGEIIAKSGAKVYENFQVRDFRGGNATFIMGTDGKGVFPLSQYYVQNIETAITFEAGAEEYVYTSLTASSISMGAGVPFIGSSGMFQPQAGGSLTKTYNGAKDRLVVEVEGNAYLASITMSMNIESMGNQTIDSSTFILPINSNIDIYINSGITTMKQDTAMLPGSTLTIANGATLVIQNQDDTIDFDTDPLYYGKNNLYIFDADEWNYGYLWDTVEDMFAPESSPRTDNTRYVYPNAQFVALSYAPGRTYNRTAADLKDVMVDVNGTLIAEGYIYTTKGGANITSSRKTGKIIMQNGAGEDPFTFQAGQNSADPVYYLIPATSAQLKNADGTYVQTDGAAAGTTYECCDHCGGWYTGEPHKQVEITWAGIDKSGTQEYCVGATPEYEATPLKADPETCKAYTFAGWGTKADGTGTKYPIGTELPAATVDAVYYAYFTESDAHSFTTRASSRLASAADCNNAATYYVQCDNCDEVDTTKTVKVGEAKGHSFTTLASNKQATAADCENAATYYVQCDNCDAVDTTKTVSVGEKLGHSFTTYVYNEDAKCEEDGTETAKCDNNCGKEDTRTAEGTALEHSFTVKQSETAATCVDTGSIVWKCANCDATNTETLEKDPDNHESTEFAYEDGASFDAKHNVVHACCGAFVREEDCTGSFRCLSIEYDSQGAKMNLRFYCDKHNKQLAILPYSEAAPEYVDGTCQTPATETYNFKFDLSDRYENVWDRFTFDTESAAWLDYTRDGETATITYVETGSKDYDNHTEAIRYENLGTDGHKAYYPCCQSADAVTAEEHTYVDGVCVCEAVQMFTITWELNGATSDDVLPTELSYGMNYLRVGGVEAPKGYRIKGFYADNKELDVDWGNGRLMLNVTGNMTIEVVLEAKTYDITWTVNGELYETTKVAYGEPIEAPAYEVPEGYTFSGWNLPETTPTTDWTVDAELTINQYTITFVDTGDTAYAPITQDYGSAVAPLSDPVKTGYTFLGWDVEIPETMPAENVTITAQWKVNTYQVNWFANGGYMFYQPSLTQTATDATFGEVIETPPYNAYVQREGHTFTGWNTEADGSGETLTAETIMTGAANDAVVYYAQWQVNEHTLTVSIGGINETVELTVPYGANLLEVLAAAEAEDKLPAKGDEIRVNDEYQNGVYYFNGWYYFSDGSRVDASSTMPAGDVSMFTNPFGHGWIATEDADGDYRWQYVDPETRLTLDEGWHYIEENYDDVEGGAWYYLETITDVFGLEFAVRAEGVTRAPYPTEPINGITYAPNPEDLEYDDFMDATESWFCFASNGQFMQQANGIATLPGDNGEYPVARKVINGQIPWHPGFVLYGNPADPDYRYFVGDPVNGGNMPADGDVYVSRNTTDRAFTMGGVYTFDDGILCEYDGITEVDGKLRYYVDAELMIGAGLVKIGENFIYVRSNGELVVNGKYWIGSNNLNVATGMYEFDENGFMIDPIDASKNGVIDGYYYVNGKPSYAGLIEYNGGYIYVTSSGKLATGKYYITKVNDTGFEPGFYYFDDNGIMEIGDRNGIIDGYYYENNEVVYNAGLIQYNGQWIYVRSNGQVATGKYWITNTNGNLTAGCYEFDENGYMIVSDKNGVVEENGSLYYYVNGIKQIGIGLVKLDDGRFIYVKTNGELATGIYWPTRTNGLLDADKMYDFGTDGYLTIN